jgi:hypothetical protein
VARGRIERRPRLTLAQRDPFQHATLSRTGSGCARFGAQRARIILSDGPNVVHCIATIGACDAAGRWPIVELCGLPMPVAARLGAPHGVAHRVEGTRVIWEVWGWPTPPLAWVERALEARLAGTRVEARWLRD